MKGKLLKNVGTLVPAVLVTGFLFILAQDLLVGEIFGWERSAVYVLVAVSSIVALDACIRMAKESRRAGRTGWSLLLYSVAIREVATFPLYVVLISISTDLVDFPPWLIFGLLVPASIGIAAANIILKAGQKYGVFEREVEPLPWPLSKMRRKR